MTETQIIPTQHKTQVIDVTTQCTSMLGGMKSGIAVFTIPHTTAALIICEDDVELRADIIKVAENWLADLRPFQHIKKNNPNTEAHILSAFGGTSVTIPVHEGKLLLGTYQTILFIELDGPKDRKLQCTTITSNG